MPQPSAYFARQRTAKDAEIFRRKACAFDSLTAMEAENRGRQDNYERAKKDGVMLKRKWIATYDMRTRHAHALLDGQLAEVDEPFESELGPIMFPGDHAAGGGGHR